MSHCRYSHFSLAEGFQWAISPPDSARPNQIVGPLLIIKLCRGCVPNFIGHNNFNVNIWVEIVLTRVVTAQPPASLSNNTAYAAFTHMGTESDKWLYFVFDSLTVHNVEPSM